MNSIIIKGRLARDPELRSTGSGVPVCTFDVAVDREYQKQGEERITDWFRCNAWRQQAEFVANYFSKGKEILIRGEMQSRKYEDKQKNNRIAWEIQVERAEFCGPKQSWDAGSQFGESLVPEAAGMEISDEDLPF